MRLARTEEAVKPATSGDSSRRDLRSATKLRERDASPAGDGSAQSQASDVEAVFGLSKSVAALGPGFVSPERATTDRGPTIEAGVAAVTELLPVSIVAEDPWVREGLRGLALAAEDWELVGVFSSLAELGNATFELQARAANVSRDDLKSESLQPVLVADLMDAQQRAIESTQLQWPDGWNVLALVSSPQEGRAAIGAGARGAIQRSSSPRTVRAGVDALSRGLMVVDPEVATPQLGTANYATTGESLSARELEVLQQMLEGRSNREIALALSISANTVKFHVNAVMTKLDASTRTEAVVQAMRQGIVHL